MLSDKTIYRDNNGTIVRKCVQKLRKIIASNGRMKKNKEMQIILKDVEFSVFSNNCLGGVFCHDAGKRFNSPTVNMAFDGEEYIKFLENPHKYLKGNIVFVNTDQVVYPVANIEDIEVRFVHYKSQAECIEMWKRRSERIIWDKLFVIATDHDGLKKTDLLKRFDRLPYKNKIMFTSDENLEYEWAICVPKFKGLKTVRIMTEFADIKGSRYYEYFDLMHWIADTCSNDNDHKNLALESYYKPQ